MNEKKAQTRVRIRVLFRTNLCDGTELFLLYIFLVKKWEKCRIDTTHCATVNSARDYVNNLNKY